MSNTPPVSPQARKLGLKPGHRVAVDEAPDGWRITEPSGDLTPVGASDSADVIVAFFTATEQLAPRLADLASRLSGPPSGTGSAVQPTSEGTAP